MSNLRRSMMMAGRGSAIDWKTLFMGLVDGSISGDITLDNSVTSIKYGAFQGCANLTGVDAPNVTSVSSNAFYEAFALTHVNIGTLQSVGMSAFLNCRSLETPIIVGNAVTSLGNTVFFNCYKMPFVDVGTGVTSIGSQTFRYMNDCQYVIMRPTTPPTLGSNNFTNSDTTTYPIYVPDASVAAYKAANNWSSLASRIFPISDMP